MQQQGGGLSGPAKPLRHLLGRETLHLCPQDHLAIFAGERVEPLQHPVQRLPFRHQAAGCAAVARLWSRGVAARAEGQHYAIATQAPLGARRVDHHVVRNGCEPAQEAARRSICELLDIPKGPEKSFLQQVVNLHGDPELVAHFVVQHHSQAAAVLVEQPGEGLLISSFDSGDESKGGSDLLHNSLPDCSYYTSRASTAGGAQERRLLEIPVFEHYRLLFWPRCLVSRSASTEIE